MCFSLRRSRTTSHQPPQLNGDRTKLQQKRSSPAACSPQARQRFCLLTVGVHSEGVQPGCFWRYGVLEFFRRA